MAAPGNRIGKKEKNEDFYKAILLLKDEEECYSFFRDVCTIAELRAEHLDPDLPVRFARILRMLSGVDTLAAAPVAVFATSLIVEGAGVSVAALALAGCWMLITVWALNTHSLKYLDDKESHPDPIPFVPDAERI